MVCLLVLWDHSEPSEDQAMNVVCLAEMLSVNLGLSLQIYVKNKALLNFLSSRLEMLRVSFLFTPVT